jgi:hypothetical protein
MTWARLPGKRKIRCRPSWGEATGAPKLSANHVARALRAQVDLLLRHASALRSRHLPAPLAWRARRARYVPLWKRRFQRPPQLAGDAHRAL